MNEAASFQAFFDSIKMDSLEEYQDIIDSINQKLCSVYYESDDISDHGLVVGSVGRGTAVSGASDLDMLFILPSTMYCRFDSYNSNGQSALLQDVKETLKEKYPKTNIKGDGQAVVIQFTNRKFTIDLVPAFSCDDGSFRYPDSNDGGRWRKTDPIPEQRSCRSLIRATRGEALNWCNALRVWKNNVGFHFKGLLIDTLVGRYFENGDKLFNDPYDRLIDLFDFLSREDRNKAYWHAIGSNQLIDNDDHGEFVSRANSAVSLLRGARDDTARERALVSLFGKVFSDCVVNGSAGNQERIWMRKYEVIDREMFIEEMFSVDITHGMSIDCEVTQNGFRPRTLSEMITRHYPLLRGRRLQFYVSKKSLPDGCRFYWKVRNCGEEAYSRNCIRGEIAEGNQSGTWCEHTDFRGSHFVECYAVKDGVCIARSRIDVPIVEK
ncbi:nucleotide-binding domain-containing protein [Pseudoscardovia suis]